jgi:signal transduction histidine kinase
VNDIVSNLRPSALDMGIVPAVGWLCNEYAAHTGRACVLQTNADQIDLDEVRAVAAFRIVQELLTNASRHAKASNVKIILTRGADDLQVEVLDNGAGFDPAIAITNRSYGLLGIRERVIALGGQINLVSAPNMGTVVTISIPVKPNGEDT